MEHLTARQADGESAGREMLIETATRKEANKDGTAESA